jgi:hypothetical protein
MAYENDQNEYPLPANGKSERRSESLLPRYFRTEANKKFLQSTLDQLIQPGVAEKLNGYYGREISKAYDADDNYVGDISTERQDYQFEPAIIARDTLDNVTFYRDYNDYLNQISIFGGNNKNQSVLNSQESYAWNPNIDFDKFTNFREYFWLPYGPQTIRIAGQSRGIESTVKVTLANNADNFAYIFSSDELVQNPTLTLYRGQKYTFEINTVGTPITIKTARTLDNSFNYNIGVSDQGIEKGSITFEVDVNAPEALYYVATNDINNSGLIQIKDIEENTEIDVEKEILGKSKYKTEGGIELSNGMKVTFAGSVTPEIYSNHEWYVEGVGDSIVLIKEEDLEIPGLYSDDKELPFDTNAFDRLPYDNANGYPGTKDYIVINRASSDRNSWSRHNRWFHKSVIEEAARFNNQDISVDQNQRATRPIIEFSAGLKLYEFGTKNKKNVDLVDTFTTDIFSTIEGAIGYSVDGVPLVNGMRVLFTAEEDILQAGKIFKVKFIVHKGKRQISLVEEDDSTPLENETILVLGGEQYKGKMFYYDNTAWHVAQEKTQVNQQPLFDLFDNQGTNLKDYTNSSFTGNKVFSYRIGTGTNDTELGFPLSYRSISNIGDLVFDFDLLSNEFTYTNSNGETVSESTSNAFLQKYKNRTSYKTINGWSAVEGNSHQRVLRQYVAESNQTDFAIDMFDNSASLNDLVVRVFVNNAIKFAGTDYEIVNINDQAVVRMSNGLSANDIVVLKTLTSKEKNSNGLYELPYNLERNPKNNDVTTFTLGEVNDHVASIVEEATDFIGEFPGSGNLRDLGDISVYGEKFLQHSGPINLAAYHLTTKNANIVKAVDFSRKEYAKFKRLFLQTSLDIGYDGNVKTHVDLIFKELNKNKNSNLPFYFSDMVPTGGAKLLEYEVFEEGNIYYALSQPFSLDNPSIKAVTVYVNGEQLTYERDYTFNAEGFCVITSQLSKGDVIDIYEYDSTDGSYVPPTPTKLGMYPKFIPSKFVDNTYKEPTEVIQGHDGSFIKAYGDYRDDLILELERRIFNNIKVNYDTDIIDIHSFIGGEYRDTNVDKESIDSSMIKDFSNWLEIAGNPDYTDFSFYERENSFTYNYSSMTSPDGNTLSGYWRAIYKQAYDTDRPHTHPWEMLGFTIKPTWWEEQYGPAPYTSNNLLMWKDLEDGIVADPSAARVVVEKYKRPNLTSHLPVDTQGNLLSPLDSRYAQNYVNRFTRNPFKFGDEAPTETAWRRSSEYPFSLFKAWILNQPAKIIGLGFDRLRTVRNSAGQLVYSETNKRIRLEDLVFPTNNTQVNAERIYSAGFINFISNYLSSNILINYNEYKSELSSITNQMAFKVGGFTDKSKFNLILDSRTPLNEGNVFIPQENFDVILQTSNPIELVTYSGVVIEKTTSGYTIRGYDSVNPEFKYHNPITSDKDPLITIGGISESYVDWASNKRYINGTIVRNNNRYYRTTETHISGDFFDGTKFAALASLPVNGGRSAQFRKAFDRTSVLTLPYGTLLKTSQEVVDFLLGYGDYLESRGFIFDSYNSNIESVENWKLSAREFLFWITQNWNSGSLISLSPGAQKIQYKTEYAVVDDVFDTFYDYGLVKADGTKINREFCNINRTNDNTFSISLKNTADGIYAIKLPLVQKEHVIVLDNETVFKDVIYDLEPGYRQERIRVLGYRTADWSGGLNVPGFIYDEAIVTEWESWKDYAIGDVVKYKEFYYAATSKITGSETFNDKTWYRLSEKPQSGLLTNLEYKTNQFADFYDLDTDNFDINQQEIAQHLIGYQKRDYLANIINDDVSQYKFYQGFIADKGSKNALTKLFDALGAADKESLEFYEEWAVRTGQYGAADGFEEIEFLLDEEQFRLSPQPILLTNTLTESSSDLVYRQVPDDIFVTPQDYNSTPFPTQYESNTLLKTAGYVRTDDVQYTLKNKDDILNLDIAEVQYGDYIWITFEKQEWNVYKHSATGFTITNAAPDGDQAILTLNKLSDYQVDDIIGIKDVGEIDGFYKVVDTNLNFITIALGDNVLTEEVPNISGILSEFVSNRVATLSDANKYAEYNIDLGEKVWVDNIEDTEGGRWGVISAEDAYNLTTNITNPTEGNESYGTAITANNDGTYIAVSSPDDGDGKVFVYAKTDDGTTFGGLELVQTLEPTTGFSTGPSKYGQSITMSPDGKYIVVGAPEASRVISAYKDNFDITSDYTRGSIVQYNNGLYKSRRSVKGRTDNIVFGTFDSASRWRSELYKLYEEYTDIPLITTGDYPLTDTTTDHILVRAPADAYEGSNVGDKVYLDWNDNSYNYNPVSEIEIVGVDLSNPVKLITNTDHGLIDGDEVIITDVPNDNLLAITEVYDNSDPVYPLDTIEQKGVKGFEDVRFFVKRLGADYLELYYNEDLTQKVNGTVGFSGEPNGPTDPTTGDLINALGGGFNGYVRKINKVFNNQHVDNGIDKSFLTNTTHVIRRKVEEVFYVVDPINIPDVTAGDKVTTETGNATVVYVKNELGRIVIYANDRNGTFDETGELFINDTFRVGEYTRPLHETVDRSSILGGYWEIATPQSYNPNGITTDTAHGLVIRDVKNNYDPASFVSPDNNWKESTALLPYKNSIQNDLDNPVFTIAGTDFPFKKETNLIRNLSYVSRGIAGAGSTDQLDNRWIVRMPKNVSDKIVADITAGGNPNLGIWLNDIPGPDGTLPDLSTVGFGEDPYTFINGVYRYNPSPAANEVAFVDVWDGWIDIDFDFTEDLQVGDIIREGNNGAQATVAHYQRDLDKVRIYIKNPTRDFSFGSRYIETTPSTMTLSRVNGLILTPIGIIESRQIGDSDIGKIAVIQHSETMPIPSIVPYTVNPNTADEIANFETQFIRDIETHFWVEEFKPGLPRNTLVPSTENNDWFEVDNIPIDTTRTASNFVREGAFFVYEYNNETSKYDLVNGFILPNREENRQLGRRIKLINDGDFYKLVINSNETLTDAQGKGRIYSILNGSDLYGTYNWSVGRDTNFKGEYSNTSDYYTDQVVVYNGTFYRALTNLQAEEFDSAKWKILGDHIDFVGYVPNDVYIDAPVVIGDDEVLSRQGLSAFGNAFDISDNGNILATIGEYESITKLLIYRLKDRHFELVSQIDQPSNSRDFGTAISVSDDGNLIAVSAPATDATKEYQGVIYVYKNVNGVYSLHQTLESPNAEQTEGFGNVIGFDGDQLVVGSARGDIILDTTFDVYLNRDVNSTTNYNSKYVNDSFSGFSTTDTTFDRGFTKFVKRIVDSGVVYVYERIKDSLVFGQRLEYRNFNVVKFGQNFVVKNDKILIGLPTLVINGTTNGNVAVYNKDPETRTWSITREPVDQVDISKFRGSFMYDTKHNEMLTRLDIIDPIAGKISGFAEQELRYKTYYDPATYNVGFNSVKDEFTTWGTNQVGKLWWDLSTVKYVNYYQGTVIYAQSVWNNLAEGASIDVYEWVQSSVLPSRWDELADTNEGIARGISGKSKYGDSKYVLKQVYDKVSQRFIQRYYFWVKDKKVLPQIEGRLRTAYNVANIIKDPSSEGLKFVTILGDNRFILHNINNLVKNKDVALNFRYWTIDNQENNIHTEYQIISDGLYTSRPKTIIEDKWFDSLIGADRYHREVPDSTLSVKQRYGIMNKPRQGMFVNRQEALKQVIERVNGVLSKQLLVDNANIEKLFDKDPEPSIISRKYDIVIDTEDELRLVGTVRAARAAITPVIEDGTVTSVVVESGGRGYRVAPTITIDGTGENLELRANINNLGIVTSVDVINGGTNYANDLSLTVRPLSVLVRADSTLGGDWAIYGWDENARVWNITTQQYYDVSDYWNYKDWYAEGYGDATAVDWLIDDYYQLNIIDDDLGDIVKISNVGSGGWILMQKIINVDTPDYTVGYQTIGRENGTIEFDSKIYTETGGSTELRKILETIRDYIFVDDLAVEYNKLFFASLRYVFSEQNYIDWAFKTSFIKAKHNVGTLEQRTTFQNDNLASYEEYVREVKPYKTKIREYLSAYDAVDNTQSILTDFDLAPFYDPERGEILNPRVKIEDGILTGINFDINTYPAKHWIDNYTFELEEIKIEDGGSGFRQPPLVVISGGGGSGAEAKAFIGSGKIRSIVVTNPGSGYTSTPTVTIEGTQEDGGTLPKLSAIISNNKVKTLTVKQKFDRITPNFEILSLPEVEEFVSSGVELKLVLKWPLDLTRANIDVLFNGNSALSSEYTYGNDTVLSDDGTHTHEVGYITLTQAQAIGTVIRVEYNKSYELLSAADRINLLYNPETGQYGKDLGQLMDGVDYGGVEVRSFEFGEDQGFDSQPWYSSLWDSYDENFDDETFYTDGSTTKFQLSKPLEPGVEYNVYINGIRIDDPNYDGSTKTYIAEDGSTVLALGNPNAIMKSVTADSSNYTTGVNAAGVTEYFIEIENIVEFEEYYTNAINNPPKEQVIVIRKSTSDGSFIPEGSGFDSLIEGGNLAYGTATGLAAADITIDGDGFVTATTSKGPEELVPGQVLDTVDIKVYDRSGDGGSRIATRNFTATATQNLEFPLDILPHNVNSILVKINGTILDSSLYEVDFNNSTVVLNSAANIGDKINILSMAGSGEQILDVDTFVGDGNTQVFVTNILWMNNISFYVTVDGVKSEVSLFETDSTYGTREGYVAMQFVTPPVNDAFIYYALFNDENIEEQPYSEVTVDRVIGDGSTSQFELSEATITRLPASHNIIVKKNNKILYPGYTQHWFIESFREYPLDRTQFDVSTLSPDQVDVYINGKKLVLLTDYRWDFANTQVVLFDNVGQNGDDLEVFIPTTSEYSFTKNTLIRLANVVGTFEPGETVTVGTGDSAVYSLTVKEYTDRQLIVVGEIPGLIETIDADKSIPIEGQTSGASSTDVLDVSLIESGTTIRLEDIPAEGDIIDVYKFSKHDLQDIEMETKTNVIRSNVTVGTSDYYNIRKVNNGLVKLRQTALDTAYVWVSVNGDLLTPNRDYSLAKMNDYIQITKPLSENDIIQVVHFAADKSNEKFGYRMFKDMLNRTHYKRLNKEKVVVLAENLNITDKTIEVVDASGLTVPSTELNIPGVLFIEGERIEYFKIDGNTISQLRRGTLGTGAREIYEAGTELMDQSASESLPYTDEMVSLIKLEDESTQIVLDWMPTYGVNEFEVFVAGRRLRKSSLESYQFQEVDENGNLITGLIDQDSPNGDITVDPEFTLTIEGDTAIVNLAETPIANTRVLIVRKVGKMWQKEGEQLRYTSNSVAEFIRGATTDLPK